MEVDLLAQSLYEGDPEPTYAWLRDEAPCYRDEANELWGVSRYADVVSISRNPDLFSSAEGSRPNIPADASMINNDDPKHLAFRRIFGRHITPRAVVEKYEARAKEITRELIDAVVERGRCDVVRDLAVPLPVRVVCHALGFPDADWERYHRFAETTMRAGGGPRYISDEIMAAAVEYFQHAAETVEAKRGSGSEDWLSLMVAKSEDGPTRRDAMELASESLLILNGGSDTTRHVIAGGTLALLEHPDQLDLLAREPERLPVAIEEMIRWVSPLLNMRRTATRDTELHGQKVRKGDQVLLMYSAANRDPRSFDAPERFDITRWPNPHLAFGIGPHFCLGANLARMELRVMFTEMLTRLRGLERADTGPPRIVSTAFARGLATLPVRFAA